MSKTEKAFWGVLLLAAGVMVGMAAAAMLAPAKTSSKCVDGKSTQRQGDMLYHTYMPALDECK